MKSAVRWFAFAAYVAAAPLLSAEEPVAALKAFWREGQTFITWQELGGDEKVAYAVYTSPKPITKDNLAGASKLAVVAPGSSFNQMVLKKAKLDPKAEITEVTPTVARYAIEDNTENDPKKFLSAATGLFVNTTHVNGKYYYAVVPVADGAEQSSRLATLPTAVEEQVLLPGAVIQWMDAFWGPFGHSWSPAQTKNAKWEKCQLANDETLPAFANASNNDDPRTAEKGQVNGKLEWSASGNDFDNASKVDDPLDSEKEWSVTIRSLSGPATVDVTPRKVRVFKITPGQSYAWENFDLADPKSPKSVAKGYVKADANKLITVEKVQVGQPGWGNRLVIQPAEKP